MVFPFRSAVKGGLREGAIDRPRLACEHSRMRTLSLAALLLLAAPALAGDEEIVRLKVGETKPGVGTFMPICDAPAIAVISSGVVRALSIGETLCSVATVQAVGLRRVYRVIVTAPDRKEPAPKEGGAKGDASTAGGASRN